MTQRWTVGRFVSTSAVYGSSAAVGKALALLTVPYLARALAPADYGVAELATSTAALLTLIVSFSGDIPAARSYSLTRDGRRRRRVLSSYIWGTALVSFAAMAALIPLAGAIAGTFWGSGGLEGLVRLTLVLVPISALQAALTQVQRIEGSPRRFAFLALFDLMAQLALAVALVGLGLGPAGVVIGFIVGSLGGLLLAALAARDVLRVKPDLAQTKGVIGRGLQFLPHVAAFVLADWSLRSIVASSLGTGDVAAMGIATRIASLLTLLGSAFALAWGPVGLARSSSPATARLFAFVLSAYGVVSVAGALILAAIGPELIRLIAGPGYEMASLILPGFAFAYAIAGAEYVLVVAAGVSERGSRVALSSSLGAAVQVALGASLIPFIGIAGLGPIAVVGRLTSFVTLLVSVRSSVAIPIGRLLGVGALALPLFMLINLALSQDPPLTPLRWALAAVLSLGAITLTVRLLRSRAPGTA